MFTGPLTQADWVVVGGIALAGLCLLVIMAPLGILHLRSRAAGVPVPMIELIGMRLRRVDARRVVAARIVATKAGLPISTISLETHALAGGDVEAVVAALVEAGRRGMPLTWSEAAAYDLAGRDVLAAVRAGVVPRVGVPDQIPRKPR